MKVLVVHAHPEPASMTGRLVAIARTELSALGHELIESDLYAMGWKAVFDASDFPERVDRQRLSFVDESGHAYLHGRQTSDVQQEQAKLLAADAVVFVFPLWWFSMPAILKGWFDRVFAYGLAYGYKGQGNTHRYGEGGLAGKRALVAVTVGGPAEDYAPRGINGDLDELLFPLTHGTLFYPGMQVLPTFAVHGAARMESHRFTNAAQAWKRRLAGLFTDVPIPFRPQNGGDYPDRHGLAHHHAPGETGLRVHCGATGTAGTGDNPPIDRP